jgi:hypothetical protein
MTGAASSILTSVSGAQAATVSEVVDSNGTALLEETATNNLTTLVGSQNTTTNVGVWTGSVTIGYARDGTGRTFALNNGVIVKDAQATTIGTPITFGASNTGANPLTGNIGITNMYNTRVADSVIGAVGTGTKYYFAGAGNDSNACTLTNPCQTITRANALTIVTNDQLNFNGGDTFTGCLTFTGGTNWNATRANPATIESYGTGQATLTPNCTATHSKIGVINLISTDGVIINNLTLLGDTAGNANRGINMQNCDTLSAHGTITIQNNTFHSWHDGTASSNDFGAAIFPDPSCNNGAKMLDHITVLNNTDSGLSGTTSTDNAFIQSYQYATCDKQYDAVQGNLVFNLGGDASGGAPEEGNGILFEGTCPSGSSSTAPLNLTTAGGIAQFNVVHDMAANVSGCGGPVGIWAFNSEGDIIRMNEVYNYLSAGGCDHGAFDLDGGVSNSLVERNYSHHNSGECLLYFGGGGSFGPNTQRWNICDGDGIGLTLGSGLPIMTIQSGGGGTTYTYNNTLIMAPVTGFAITYTGCPSAGSLFANNIIVNQVARNQNNMFSMGPSAGTQCSPAPTGNLQITHNDWFGTNSSVSFWATTNDQSFTPPLGSNTTYASMASVLGEAGGQAVNPQFSGSIGANVTCNSAVGSPGPQANGCPTGYTLAGGSPMAAPAGATLASSPFNLPAGNLTNGQGTLSYYGAALPCGSGYPIGADCGTGVSPPPSFSLNFTTGSLPSCSGCNVTFTGGANASYYNASNVLIPVNSANTPRFDHNPANGAALGILIEPARGNYWASSNMTAGNTQGADNDHAELNAILASHSETTQAWFGVWGTTQETSGTGPDNVANSAGRFFEDKCSMTSGGTPANPNPPPCTNDGSSNAGDGGHPSANALLPGIMGSSPFQLLNQNVIISEYVRDNSDAGDAGRGLSWFSTDTQSSGQCVIYANLTNGSLNPATGGYGGTSCTNGADGSTLPPPLESINIAGNHWFRVQAVVSIAASLARINAGETINNTSNALGGYTGDGHSGFLIYGVQVTPAPTGTVICKPGVSGTVPCTANSYIANLNVYTAPQMTTADSLSFTVPAGLCALTYTFDDNSTQKITIGGSCAGSSTAYTVPTNLNRPWIQTIVGSAS